MRQDLANLVSLEMSNQVPARIQVSEGFCLFDQGLGTILPQVGRSSGQESTGDGGIHVLGDCDQADRVRGPASPEASLGNFRFHPAQIAPQSFRKVHDHSLGACLLDTNQRLSRSVISEPVEGELTVNILPQIGSAG